MAQAVAATNTGGQGQGTYEAAPEVEFARNAVSRALPDPDRPGTLRALPGTSANSNGKNGGFSAEAFTGESSTRNPGTEPAAPLAPVPLNLPFETPVPDRFTLLQKWEGTVLRCLDAEFTAVLREKGAADEEATFDVEEVPEADRELIAPGAVFHWSIGYRDRRGQRTRESVIRFRRLPAWTKREIERAKREADEIIAALHWGEQETAR